ncbi:hypothetical protein JOD52_001935 [Brachybacterium muris]|uniref:hypothetical protein n=1 Tax=Brachybacterium muris TaxID=219301 RepID=UPI0019586A27|nr:hypothetical protein [Brachybacterium muris]MBM7501095.1 hypothetical protein [Brachybacterium muris]MCT1430863.1 hypothetical protein [Brachybacterium muris]
MIQAGDIAAMQTAPTVRFEHRGTIYEGRVQWIEDNDSILSHEKRYPGCVSLMLSSGQTENDLPRTTPVETSR